MKGLSMISWLKTSALVVFVSVALLSACKQGVGEVCQIDDDCEDGLVCNQQTAECQGIGGGGTDAAVFPDAIPAPDAGPTPDASPPSFDATPSVDADITPDATPPIDAP